MTSSSAVPARLAAVHETMHAEFTREHADPWIVAYSGGKDSTLLLQLAWEIAAAVPTDAPRRPIYVVSNDTLVESPLVIRHLRRSLEVIREAVRDTGLPITIKVTEPCIDQTFWVNVIGRGYIPPTRNFRWCTDRMKIAPTNDLIHKLVLAHQRAILLVGTRKSESQNRGRAMTERGVTATTMNPHSTIPNCRMFAPLADLRDDDVWKIILVPYETEKARKIFTRVNRYAKPTTTGQNIVTDDDDVIAVLTREVANDLIGGRLVKFKSNTLRPKDPEFTTLAIVYNVNEKIVTKTFFSKGRPDRMQLPDEATQRLYRKKITDVWKTVLDGIEVFADAIDDREESGDDGRRRIRETSLLGRPVAQECLVCAFVRLTGPPTNMSADDACRKLNDLPWGMSVEHLEQVWQRVLWTGGTDGKVVTKNRTLATDVIAFWAGERVQDKNRAELLESYRKQFPEGERDGLTLPTP